MRAIPVEWFENDNVNYGYKWSVQSDYGIIVIEKDELFSRIEFDYFETEQACFDYAHDQGWRFNVDNQKWYRIKGY